MLHSFVSYRFVLITSRGVDFKEHWVLICKFLFFIRQDRQKRKELDTKNQRIISGLFKLIVLMVVLWMTKRKRIAYDWSFSYLKIYRKDKEDCSSGANRVIVCNIHVLYNPNRGDIKLGQVLPFLYFGLFLCRIL